MARRILVLGGGGREHALAWRIAACPNVEAVLVAPGNGGTELGVVRNVALGKPSELTALARRERIDLTVVGPERPLVAGIADIFAAEGLAILGPTAAAAKLEGSKSYAKQFMLAQGIPSPPARTCASLSEVQACLRRQAPPYVLKADGLAGGKGVVIEEDLAAAEASAAAMLAGRFGDSSRRLLVEEYCPGQELSLISLCDGERAAALALSRDYKRLGEGNVGPNTGGMGAEAPIPPVGAATEAQALMEMVVMPVLRGMKAAGHPYRGFLYAGLMVTPDTVQVLEFNCRLGDPEAQVILPLWAGDMLSCLEDAAAGRLDPTAVTCTPGAAVGVVVAAAGYPAQPRLGERFRLPEDIGAGINVFHGGTRRAEEGGLIVTGGRILCLSALGANRAEAGRRAYLEVAKIRLKDSQYRRDIAACAHDD